MTNDILAAWRSARLRKGVDKLAGIAYAEVLRRGKVPPVERLAKTLGVKQDRAERALNDLRNAELLPAIRTSNRKAA